MPTFSLWHSQVPLETPDAAGQSAVDADGGPAAAYAAAEDVQAKEGADAAPVKKVQPRLRNNGCLGLRRRFTAHAWSVNSYSSTQCALVTRS